MSRKGIVKYKGMLAGYIQETDDGYSFWYDPEYISDSLACPISVTMPLQKEYYQSSTLHPFFDGLIPEGWILAVAAKNWKIDMRDRMGLLLAVCKDCIGAVSVEVHDE
ncbi:MAG: HipA N-terminal domain-containing protein [Fibrobacterota bacterium]|jgi:serine/threonine-protein kinase HipA